MKLAAATAIASVIPERELLADYIVPSVFNRHVSEVVAAAVADAAVATGVARRARPGAHTAEAPATGALPLTAPDERSPR